MVWISLILRAAVLAHHFILAQRDARMGFPEIAFNLFPGMGGYSLVSRRSGMKLAEQLIYRGVAHTAEWLLQNRHTQVSLRKAS